MASGLEIMQAHLAKGSGQGPHNAIGRGAWNTLLRRGWHPQQITAVAPSTGMQVGAWVQNQMTKYPNATRNVGGSGLYNIGTAQKWVGQGQGQNQIQAHGSVFANTPRGRESTRRTGRTGWQAGFTADAASWLSNKWDAEAREDAARKLREEAPEEDPQWATDLSQTLTDLN